MKIFYASDTTPNVFLGFQSNIWRSNLFLALNDLGHEVIEFEYDLSETFKRVDKGSLVNRCFMGINRPKVSRELLRQIRAAHVKHPIDLFFSYFYDTCVLPETIDEIKNMGIKTVNWYCNGSYQLHLVSEISPHYDWCLVPEKFRLDSYRAMAANPIYCQEAANPSVYRPYDATVDFDVTFVGQVYGDRPHYLKYLVDNGIDVRVWGIGWEALSTDFVPRSHSRGPGKTFPLAIKMLTPANVRLVWNHIRGQFGSRWSEVSAKKSMRQAQITLPAKVVGPPVTDREMIKMFSRSKINLGFSSCGETHRNGQRILQVRLRDFEVPMSGGFYMVEYMDELEEFYEIGKEIVCYGGPEDLLDKIKYYLSHHSEREAIRNAGYKRCLRDHTWQKRLQDAFQEMGLE